MGKIQTNLSKAEEALFILLKDITDKRKLHQFSMTFKEYISKMNQVISSNLENIFKHFETYQKHKLQREDLIPVMELLQRIGQGNNSI